MHHISVTYCFRHEFAIVSIFLYKLVCSTRDVKIHHRASQCIGMQPFSHICKPLIISCYHKNFMMITETAQQLSCSQTHTQTPTNRHY